MPYKQPISGVYRVVNTTTGEQYIGSSVNIKSRWSQHRHLLRRGTHKNPHLQASYNIYGVNAFHYEIVEHVEPALLIEREQYYLDTFKPEYNKWTTADSAKGTQYTAEIKERMGVAKRGRKLTPEHRAKLGKIRKGRTVSAETRARMSAAQRTPEMLARKREYHRNKGEVSPETRAKLSEANRRWQASPGYEEHRAKMVRINTGKTVSAETCAKISQSKRRQNELRRNQRNSAIVYSGEVIE